MNVGNYGEILNEISTDVFLWIFVVFHQYLLNVCFKSWHKSCWWLWKLHHFKLIYSGKFTPQQFLIYKRTIFFLCVHWKYSSFQNQMLRFRSFHVTWEKYETSKHQCCQFPHNFTHLLITLLVSIFKNCKFKIQIFLNLQNMIL